MAVLKLKYIHAFRDRHGKQRYYFRRAGYERVPLPGLPGSEEFMAEYQAALSGAVGGRRQIGKDRVIPGTISAAVVGYLQSVEFLTLAKATQDTRRRSLNRFRLEHGDKPIRSLQKHHIQAMMAKLVATPNAANNLLHTVRWIMSCAIAQQWRKDDPSRDIKTIRTSSEGFHSWSEEEIAQFAAYWPVGTTQRLAFDLLLHTGQRSGDVRRMTRGQIKDGVIHVRQSKTGAEVFVPITPELQASLDKSPPDRFVLVMTQRGAPFTEKGFGNFVSDAARRAGLPVGCSAHGLRKAAATRLAEADCTPHQIMSITGHKTLKEVERYTEKVRQRRLARDAMAKVLGARSQRRMAD